MRSAAKGSSPATPSNLNRNNGEVEQMEMQDPTSYNTNADSDPSLPSTTQKSSCVNENLVALKAILFFFYGGLGIISTWLNHTVLAQRFTERDTALVYGISSFLSIATPILFGLISDKSGHPKKVLVICLFLSGLIYPWIMAVPTSEPFHFKERLDWCRGLGRSDKSCMPYKVNCTSSHSELITNYGGVCSDGCQGKIIMTKCRYNCEDEPQIQQSKNKNSDYDEFSNNKILIEAAAQIATTTSEPPDDDENEGGVDLTFGPDPHVCLNKPLITKYRPLCYVFDEDMHDIVIKVKDISGYKDPNDEGKCHYPLLEYSETKKEFEQLLSCSPLSGPHCHVACDLRWDIREPDQWVCRNDYNQWLISFSVFLIIYTIGTMLVISAAGLLNAAVVSMAHEHEHGDFFGCQLVYGTFGFALFTPIAALIFYFIQTIEWNSNVQSLITRWNPFPRNLEYFIAYTFWLLISGCFAISLNYHAEWVPKPSTIRPMLVRWCLRGTTLTFFHVLVILGCFQGMIDVLGYYQIKNVGGLLYTIGLGATAGVIPAIIFIYRVEKVIEFCGHHNILAIALVVFSLQFTGYAYLRDVAAEWSFLLKAMDTFSIVMVWVTASFITHNSAPRSLVATSQSVIVTLYCCVGRGFGCMITYFGLSVFSKDFVLKTASVCSIITSVCFLFIHYCCLKPPPYSRKYDVDKPVSQGPSGKYKPLKLTDKKLEDEDKETDEL